MYKLPLKVVLRSRKSFLCFVAGFLALILTLIQIKVGLGVMFFRGCIVISCSAKSSKVEKPQTKSFDTKMIHERFLERKLIMDDGCANHVPQKRGQPTFDKGDYLTINGTALYCPIEKTASITWRGIFDEIQRKGVQVNTIGYFMLYPLDLVNLFSNLDADIRFIFVREPYGRHVSAYVDKLFSPNIEFWRNFGKHIIHKFRPNATVRSKACGHDVTFAEYIKYVIDAERSGDHRDGHFLPQHCHCHICRFPYNYIGHLETMEEDTKFLLKAIRSPVDYNQDYGMFTMEDQARWYFGDRTRYGHCMELEEALRRYWKKLQIRGLVHKTFSFPFTAEQLRSITATDLIREGRKAVLKSREQGGAKGNKREALIEAFQSVSADDKDQLRQLYWRDFELFGYNPSPEDIFGNNTVDSLKNDRKFSYFSVWD